MLTRWCLLLFVCLSATAGHAASWNPLVDDQCERSAFDRAAIVPDDVTLYVQLHEPRALRDQLTTGPLAQWVDDVIGDAAIADAWHNIADAAGMSEPDLFDRFLGRNLTLAVRGERHDWQWAIITTVHPDSSERLLRRLKARIHGHRRGAAHFSLPEHELQVAVDGSLMLIGPKKHDELFKEIVASADEPNGRSLDQHDAVERGRSFDAGDINILLRHDPSIGGWSVLVGRMDGPALRLRHEARFDRAPRSRGRTELTISGARRDRLPDDTILALVEPTDLQPGKFEHLLRKRLGIGLLAPELRDMVGEEQLLIIGRHDVPLDDETAMSMPSITRAWSVNAEEDAEHVRRAIDLMHTHTLELLDRINRTLGEPLDLPPRDELSDEPNSAASVGIAPLLTCIVGQRSGLSALTISWGVYDGPGGRWALISTDPDHLQRVGRRLVDAEQPRDAPDDSNDHDADPPRWAAFGRFNGPEAADLLDPLRRHLDAWANPRHHDRLKRSLATIADFARAVHRIEWSLRRSASDRMETEIRIELAGGEIGAESKPPTNHDGSHGEADDDH